MKNIIKKVLSTPPEYPTATDFQESSSSLSACNFFRASRSTASSDFFAVSGPSCTHRRPALAQ